MPILFQFFKATDLAKLNEDQLAALNKAITNAIESPASSPPPEVQQRAQEVFRQFRPDHMLQPVQPRPSAPLLDQLVSAEDLALLSVTEHELLSMAVKHTAIYGYSSMDTIKTRMLDKFVQLHGSTPAHDPDSPLSPYNPVNPDGYPLRNP